MKYTSYDKQELDDALTQYFPLWREAGCERPEALKRAALHCWLERIKNDKAEVLRSAYNDLFNKGQFIFKETA